MYALSWILLSLTAPVTGSPSVTPPPIRSDNVLSEKAQARLVQIYVAVDGPGDVVWRLQRPDFQLKVGGRKLASFAVDNACAPVLGVAEPGTPSEPLPVSLVFYFDEPQLAPQGRARAYAVARDLVRSLIRDGNRGMVVSGDQRLRIVADWTADPVALLAAIDRSENDATHRDESVALESLRARRLQRELEAAVQRIPEEKVKMMGPKQNRGVAGVAGPDGTIMRLPSKWGDAGVVQDATQRGAALAARSVAVLAQYYQTDERQRSTRSIDRLSGLMSRLAEIRAPKAIVYFADALRKNPGEHYFTLIQATDEWGALSMLLPGLQDAWLARYSERYTAEGILTPLLHEAAAKNVRLYTLQAEGLVDTTSREKDARATLTSLSLETGGEAFLNGVPADRVAARIMSSLRCSYVLSFDPKDLPEDRPLPVVVRTSRAGVSVRSQGRIVIESEARREVSRLIGAALGASEDDGKILSVGAVPLGWSNGKYSALVQVVAPPGSTNQDWELATVRTSVARFETGEARRISAPAAVPLALEEVVEFKQGDFEVVALGRNLVNEQPAASRLAGRFPDLDAGPATITPIAFVQPMDGAFVRAAEVKQHGLVVLADAEMVNPRSPTVAVSLVCRSKDGPRAPSVRREIAGEATVPFPDMTVDLRDARCAQVRDLVPANTFGAGRFQYRIEVLDDQKTLAAAQREFQVAIPRSVDTAENPAASPE